VALAPLLFVAVYLPGQVMLRCRMDGVVRPACCCPAQDERKDTGPVVEAQGCCDRQITANERPAVEAARRAEPGMAPAAVALAAPLPVLFDAPATRPGQRAAQRDGPAREGPLIVLVKHAFLI
jgi:hypothetical protein